MFAVLNVDEIIFYTLILIQGTSRMTFLIAHAGINVPMFETCTGDKCNHCIGFTLSSYLIGM